jgi:ribonuclease HI
MYFDGSLKLGGGGAGVLFISPRGEKLKYVFQILFEVSNNKAKYEALLHGLRLAMAISLGIKRLLVYGNFLLVVQQLNKEWDINKDTMGTYSWNTQAREKVLGVGNSPCGSQQPCGRGHALQIGFGSS